MRITPQPQAIRVMGIELRTSNAEALQTIAAFWQRFHAEQVLDRIPGKRSAETYAVYTHFENAGVNNEGRYSLILGAAVAADAPVAPGLTHAVLPACRRAVFAVPAGDPQRVLEVWQRIWQITDMPKAFVADYEVYRPDGTIDIAIGLR